MIEKQNPSMQELYKLGKKDDKGKLLWHLLPWPAVKEIVKVLMKGAEHYAPNNWKLVDNWRDRYFDACMRHLVDWREGARVDPQWGLHHLAHAGCCVLFLLALDLPGTPDPHPYPDHAPVYGSDP